MEQIINIEPIEAPNESQCATRPEPQEGEELEQLGLDSCGD